MKLQIIVFGKTAKKFFLESEKFYLDRISHFSTIEYKVLPEEKISKTVSGEILKKKEAEKFFTIFPEKNFLFACDPNGKNFSSEEFSKKIQNTQLTHSGITFVVGGALGLSNDILQRADQQISFSKMTFPHDLFRTLLFEQIYRSFMIKGNREYHK